MSRITRFLTGKMFLEFKHLFADNANEEINSENDVEHFILIHPDLHLFIIVINKGDYMRFSKTLSIFF